MPQLARFFIKAHEADMKIMVILLCYCLGLAACSQEAIISPLPPKPDEAKQAIATMFGGSASALIAKGGITLGRCIVTPAKYQPLPGQYSCTFLLLSPGGSSESRADFILTRQGWEAQPSATEDELPFPDPALNQ